MPVKKIFRYKVGKTEVEADPADKHAVRLAYINTIMYWIVKTLGASGAAIKFLQTLLP